MSMDENNRKALQGEANYIQEKLIKKHLEGWNGLEKASIEHYHKTGIVSGSLFLALKKMMTEYRELT